MVISASFRAKAFAPLILAAAILSLFVAGLVVACNYERELRRATDSVLDLGGRLAESAGHELAVREMSVRGMQLMGQRLLAARFSYGEDPLSHITPIPGKEAYTYTPPAPDGSRETGNVTGFGKPPARGSVESYEMRMALALTPLFRILVERNPDTPWVYYTSLSGFMYLYPYVDPAGFILSPEILDLEFMRNAGPEANPSRSVFWTSVYEDAAGKGPMVTVSAPLYLGGELRGAISADISIGELGWILRLIAIPDSTVHLLDARHKEILSTGPALPFAIDGTEKVGTMVKRGRDWLAVFPLEAGGWSMAVVADGAAVERATLLDTLPLAYLVLAFAGILVLILALTRSLGRVEELSTTDHLTGLLNRRMFELQAEEEFARAKRKGGPVGLAIFDIDDFKKLNDSRGHQEGDRALKAIAGAARASLLRATDKIFRIGGEEFAILVETGSEEQLEASMTKVVEAIAALDFPHPLGTHGKITVSMGGIFVKCCRDMGLDEAYRIADAALYKAKSGGKNRVVLGSP